MRFKKQKIFILATFLILTGAGCTTKSSEPMALSSQIGDDDAPILIEEYFDYQCTACMYGEKTITPFLMEDYIDIGKAKIVYKNFAFMGETSRRVANAALCAEEQGKFYDFHKKVFEAQGAEGASAYDSKFLKKTARNLGLISTQFDLCLDSNKYKDQVASDINEARKNKITSTPTYIINGEKVSGAGSYLSVKRIIDRKLSEIGL